MAEAKPIPFCVHLLPALIPPGALSGGIAVVVDVLRAASVIIHALAAGCAAVVPCLEIDEARRIAAGLPKGSALLAGERHGRPIEGFDLANSPAAFSPDACRGKTVVLTTTNGTRALLACLEAEVVLVAAFNNLGATAGRLADLLSGGPARSIHVVCSGTEGTISWEDSLLAGALIDALMAEEKGQGDSPGASRDNGGVARAGRRRWSIETANDEAILSSAAWLGTVPGHAGGESLARMLVCGRGGQNVHSLGLDRDIIDAADIDRFDLVVELRRDPLRLVAAR